MNMKLTAVSTLALWLGGCALAPGGHIPDDSSGGLFSDDSRSAYEQEFSEAELMKLVDVYQISPMLISEMQTPATKPEFNSALEQARNN